MCLFAPPTRPVCLLFTSSLLVMGLWIPHRPPFFELSQNFFRPPAGA
jgi:hypothetical protein